MSRGNAGQRIFEDDDDYRRFLQRLIVVARRLGVQCFAYCLMPNHFHLLVEPDQHSLSRLMQQLNSSYCQRFNRRHQRVGHVLQGRFRALVIDRHDYFRRVLRYIALNPVRAGLVSDPADWQWSSYSETAGLTAGGPILTVPPVWSAFAPFPSNGPQSYAAFVAAGHGGRGDEPRGRVAWGSQAFVATINVQLDQYRHQRDVVYSERLAGRPSLDLLFATACDSRTLDRRMHNAFNRHGYTLAEIGTFVGRPPATVWRRIHRVVAAANCHQNAKIEI